MKNSKAKRIIIILAILVFGYLIYDFTPVIKSPISKIVYGNNQCTLLTKDSNSNNQKIIYGDKNHPVFGGCMITLWKCNLCWRFDESGTTNTPELCNLCSRLTNRCNKCGDLLK